MIAEWEKERQHLPPYSISFRPGGSQGQHGKKARDRRGPPTDSMKKDKAKMIAKARSMSKRKVNIIRGEIEHKRLKKQKLEKLLPKPDGHVEEEIGNDCTWGVLYLILRGFVNRSLTPVKGRSLTPLRHRAHGPLSHFESNSCTGPMSRILSPARQSRVPATVLPRKSRLRGGLGTSLGGFGGLWAAFGWFLAPRGLLGVL